MRALCVLVACATGCAATVKGGEYFAVPLERAVKASAAEARFRVQPAPAGCGTERAPIVFLPGLGMTQHSWAGVTAALGSCRARVLVDLPGMGEAPYAEPDEQTVLDALVDVVDAVAPSSQVVLAGHSLGGVLAARLAARLGARVEGLVLVAAPVAAITLSWELRLLLRFNMVWPPALHLLGVNFGVRVGLPFVSKGVEASALDQALLAADWSDHRRRRAMLAYHRHFLTPTAIDRTSDALYAIRVPTLLIWGGEDELVSASVLAAAQTRLREARVTTLVVPGVGHLVPMAAPRVVAAAIDAAIDAPIDPHVADPASVPSARQTRPATGGHRPSDRIWGPRHEVFPIVGVGALFALDGRTDLSLVLGVARGGIDRHYPLESGRLALTVGAAIRAAPTGWSFAYLRATARLELVWRWVGGYHVDGTLLVDPRTGYVGGYGAIGYTPSVVPWLRGFIAGGLLPGDSAPRFLVGMELDARLTGWLY